MLLDWLCGPSPWPQQARPAKKVALIGILAAICSIALWDVLEHVVRLQSPQARPQTSLLSERADERRTPARNVNVAIAQRPEAPVADSPGMPVTAWTQETVGAGGASAAMGRQFASLMPDFTTEEREAAATTSAAAPAGEEPVRNQSNLTEPDKQAAPTTADKKPASARSQKAERHRRAVRRDAFAAYTWQWPPRGYHLDARQRSRWSAPVTRANQHRRYRQAHPADYARQRPLG